MDKEKSRQEKNEVKGSIGIKKNKENLEISATGYGYQTVSPKANQNNRKDM